MMKRLLFDIATLLIGVTLLSSCGLQGCSHAAASQATGALPIHTAKRSIYHWKTTFDPTSWEQDFVRRHAIQRLYLRLFDVGVDGPNAGDGQSGGQSGAHVVPIGTTVFRQPVPDTLEVVPTVFITVEALRQMSDSVLVDKILTRVDAMCRAHGIRYDEVQLDCDWTKSTRALFYALCSQARERLHREGRLLSLTVRLHQLAEALPPMDCGVLMLYNTESLHRTDVSNSILNPEVVTAYVRRARSKLPLLDLALPAYGWQLWFRDNTLQAILTGVPVADSQLFAVQPDSTYRLLRDELQVGTDLLQRGDVVRTEQARFADVVQARDVAARGLKLQPEASVVVYHLDSLNLSKFSYDEVEKIYSR